MDVSKLRRSTNVRVLPPPTPEEHARNMQGLREQTERRAREKEHKIERGTVIRGKVGKGTARSVRGTWDPSDWNG